MNTCFDTKIFIALDFYDISGVAEEEDGSKGGGEGKALVNNLTSFSAIDLLCLIIIVSYFYFTLFR